MANARTERPDRPTLEYLLQNNLPVFVLNKIASKTTLLLTAAAPGQRPTLIPLPKTWVPIDLLTHASAMSLQYCNDLINLCRRDRIKLLWPEEARDILADPDARDELMRVTKLARGIMTDVDGPQQPDEITSVLADYNRTEMHNPQINENVLEVIEQFKSGDLTLKSLYGEVRTLEDDLSSRDFAYIMSQIPDGKLKDYAKERMAALASKPRAERHNAPSAGPRTAPPVGYSGSGGDELDGLSQEELAEESARAARARAKVDTESDEALRIATERLKNKIPDIDVR